jgi:hypothetical protein
LVVVGRGVSVDPQSLSREELVALVVDQAVLIGQLRAEIAELRRVGSELVELVASAVLGQPVRQADAEGVGDATRWRPTP